MSSDLVMIACPPFSDYEEAPADHSQSELFDCPKCNKKMWLSEKKKGVIMFSACSEKNILLACYHCIIKIVENDPSLLFESTQVNI